MATTDDRPLVELNQVTKLFDVTPSITGRLLGGEKHPVRAVDDIDLDIQEGEVVGIAGESGCGKTTVGKLLVKLHEPTHGQIKFDGKDISRLSIEEEKEFRQRVQMIFQDPFESLNPRMTVLDTVMEPLRINDVGEGYHDRRERVIETLEDVGMKPAETYLNQFPAELSGGEKQRVAIARALVVDPEFIVADEPVSMLDVSIRASVLNLMQDLRDEYGLTYLFISHDLSLVRYMCDRTAIMYLGDIVEVGDTDDVIDDPQHPYTQELFEAVPKIDPGQERQRANVTGEVPDAREPPAGCKFHPRCPEVIEPDGWPDDQSAYRRYLQFKLNVRHRDLDPEEFDVPRDASQEELVEETLSQGMMLDVPEEHREEGENPQRGVDVSKLEFSPGVEETLRSAAEDVVDLDFESAFQKLDGEYRSVCETVHPEMRAAGEQETACHLYGSGEPTGTEAVATGDD